MGDKNLLLVSSIQKFPCLYNYNLQDYMKKEVTEKAWNEVAFQTTLTVAECKEKWRNLRYSLLRSLKPNPDGTCKKKYYLHNEMEFLIPFMKLRTFGSNTHFEEDIDEETLELSHEVITSPQQQLFEYEYLTEPMTKRKRNVLDPFNHIQTSNDCESRRQFMLGLMPEVNALTENQMKIFRRKVLALLDDITEKSEINMSGQEIKAEPGDNVGDSVYPVT